MSEMGPLLAAHIGGIIFKVAAISLLAGLLVGLIIAAIFVWAY